MTKVQLRKPAVRINEPASVPIYPSGPNHPMHIALGIFAGFSLV